MTTLDDDSEVSITTLGKVNQIVVLPDQPGPQGEPGPPGPAGADAPNLIPADEFIGERLADADSAARAGAAAQFALDPKASLSGVTGVFAGNSWANGNGITSFIQVGLVSLGVAIAYNRAVAGYTSADVAALMLRRDATYGWDEGDGAVFAAALMLNNARFVDLSLDANAKWLRAMKNDIRLLCAVVLGRAPVYHDDASVTYNGTWAVLPYSWAADATSVAGTVQPGAGFQIDFEDEDEITVVVGNYNTESAAVIDWYLDGVKIRTTELNNDVLFSGVVQAQKTVVMTPERFTGLAPGAHTLIGVKADATSAAVYLNCWIPPSDSPPAVVLYKEPTLPADVYAMYDPYDNGSDASIYAGQAAIDEVAEEFTGVWTHQLPVLTPVTDFQGDFIHPDASGRDILAASAELAFDPQVLADRAVDLAATNASKRASGAFDRRNHYGTQPSETISDFDEAVVAVTRVFFEETTTAAATAAKTLTTTWTPTLGDKLYLSLDLGNTVASPTLNINGGGAKAIWLGGNPVLADAAGTGANGVWELIYDGTRWHMLGSVLNVDVATQAEFDAHVTDTTAAHAASAVSYAGSTSLAATDVEAALDELDTEKQPLIVAATTATAVGTAAKTATIGSYTPVNGSLLVLTLTNGNSAAAPTINIDSGGAKNIWAMGFALTAETAVALANTQWLLRYDGTQWHLLNSPNYTLPSQAIAEAGSSVAGYYWSPQRVSQAVLAHLLTATATLDFPSIAAGGQQELTITVTGAAVNDSVDLGPPSTLPAGLQATGYVSATNTVTVRLSNVTGSAVDPASATWRARVVR